MAELLQLKKRATKTQQTCNKVATQSIKKGVKILLSISKRNRQIASSVSLKDMFDRIKSIIRSINLKSLSNKGVMA